MNPKERVLIIGGGPAGIRTAIQLQKIGIQPEIIEPRWATNRFASERVVTSTPFLSHTTAKRMDLVTDQNYEIRQVHSLESFHRSPLLWFIARFVNTYARANPFYALSYPDIMRQLTRQAEAARVLIMEDRATGVIFDGRRVSGVQTAKNGIVSADATVDATGHAARLVEEVRTHYPDMVNEVSVAQPSHILGGYIRIPELSQGSLAAKRFSDRNHTLYLSSVRKENYMVLAPIVPTDDSPATHLILYEGDQSEIGAVDKRVSSRLVTLQRLAQRSPFGDLLKNVNYIDKTVSFTYTNASYRDIESDSFAAVGDAQRHFNPASATGFARLAADGHMLRNQIHNKGTIAKGIAAYNERQKQINPYMMWYIDDRYCLLQLASRL